jgi:hypothetical protein
MNLIIRKPLQLGVAAIMGIGALFASEQFTQIGSGSLVSKAEAWIGRPLTPMSYAGVARRTTRRAYGYGAGVYAPASTARRCMGLRSSTVRRSMSQPAIRLSTHTVSYTRDALDQSSILRLRSGSNR